jgi:hypothetical protein
MEQQQQPENVMSINIVIPPPVPNNIVTPSSPTNINPPPIPTNTVPFVLDIPLQTIAQIPPLGPAPAQLPPLVHPPPPGVPLQSVIQEIKVEPIVPIQIQFETLCLNTPLEPILPIIPQSSITNDFTQINNELSPSQEFVDGNAMAAPPIDSNAAINPTDESSLVPEEGKSGT